MNQLLFIPKPACSSPLHGLLHFLLLPLKEKYLLEYPGLLLSPFHTNSHASNGLGIREGQDPAWRSSVVLLDWNEEVLGSPHQLPFLRSTFITKAEL